MTASRRSRPPAVPGDVHRSECPHGVRWGRWRRTPWAGNALRLEIDKSIGRQGRNFDARPREHFTRFSREDGQEPVEVDRLPEMIVEPGLPRSLAISFL